MKKRVLVTGAGGFIGHHLVKYLKAHDCWVRGVDIKHPEFEETVEEQKVKAVGFRIGESKIEFLEATSADSPIAKYLEKRGEGLHHIALSVNDIAAVLQSMKERGLRLIDEEPKTGAEGKKIAFVHPKSVNGILLELSQE